MKAKYDIERAKLDVSKGDTVSRIENEQAKLALADAEQRLQRARGEDAAPTRRAAEADLSSKRRKREKALFDLEARGAMGCEKLQLKAPTDGIVNILPNYRSGQHDAAARRSSARAIARGPGAAILELPDLSSVHLQARLDESDRGRLKAGQDATVRIEAVPGQRLQGAGSTASRCWRRSTSPRDWPPPKNFDLDLVLHRRRSEDPARA